MPKRALAGDPPTSVPTPSATPAPDSASTSSSSLPRAQVVPFPRTFTDGLPLPRVLVFDLDYTLWNCWVDTHPTPPFKSLQGPEAGKKIIDRRGERYGFYSEVPGILAAARARGMKVAAASRTHAPDLAAKFLTMLTVDAIEEDGKGSEHSRSKPAKEFFNNMQIYPGNKVQHMEGIKKALNVDFADMVFWDDEERNRNVERERGVCFWLVRDGVTREEIDRGIEKWRKDRAKMR